MFQGFPEIKEALMSNKIQAAFMVAPMAIALRAQGVPVKIVYLGHRYGSAVVVRSDGPVHRVSDLRGRIIAIPSRAHHRALAGVLVPYHSGGCGRCTGREMTGASASW